MFLTILAEVASAPDPMTIVAGVVGTLLTALTGVQTGQLSGLRHDFQTYRDAQDKRILELEGRVNVLEDERVDVPVEPARRRKPTGAHSTTTRGRRSK